MLALIFFVALIALMSIAIVCHRVTADVTLCQLSRCSRYAQIDERKTRPPSHRNDTTTRWYVPFSFIFRLVSTNANN